MDILDEWSPSLSEDQKNKVLKDNFRKIGTALQFTGGELIGDYHNQSVTSVASATFTNIPAFNGSFQSSGSFVSIDAIFTVQSTSTAIVYVQLLVDGILMQTIASSGNSFSCISMSWKGNVLAGKHTVKINIKSNDASNVNFGLAGVDSGYYVTEFRKG